MKKYLSILTIASFLCFSFKSNGQTYSYTLTNFTSTCVKPTLPRQFTLTFKVTLSGGTATSVLFTTTNGNFNAIPNGVTFPLVGNTANITLTYSEIMPQSTVPIQMIFSDGTTNLLRPLSSQTLCSCGANCNANWIKIDTTNTIAHYGAPGVHLMNSHAISVIAPGGLLAGPDKVKSIVTTISNTERKLNCSNPPGTWTSVALQMQPVGSVNFNNSNTSSTQNFGTAGTDISTVNDYAFTVALPSSKLVANSNCPEIYRMKITIAVNFVNGCSKTISFWKTATRP